MIQIKYKDDIHDIRNTLDEITVEEFEYITAILTSTEEASVIDIWIDILTALNVDVDLLDDIDLEAFTEVIHSFDFITFDKTIQKSISIDGNEYVC